MRILERFILMQWESSNKPCSLRHWASNDSYDALLGLAMHIINAGREERRREQRKCFISRFERNPMRTVSTQRGFHWHIFLHLRLSADYIGNLLHDVNDDIDICNIQYWPGNESNRASSKYVSINTLIPRWHSTTECLTFCWAVHASWKTPYFASW